MLRQANLPDKIRLLLCTASWWSVLTPNQRRWKQQAVKIDTCVWFTRALVSGTS